MDPATNRSKTLRVSLSLPIKRLIWEGRLRRVSDWTELRFHILYICIHSSYLLICHKFQGRLRSNFDDIHTISAPQWSHTAFFNHLHQASHQAHVVGSRPINLQRNMKPLKLKNLTRVPLKVNSLHSSSCFSHWFYTERWGCRLTGSSKPVYSNGHLLFARMKNCIRQPSKLLVTQTATTDQIRSTRPLAWYHQWSLDRGCVKCMRAIIGEQDSLARQQLDSDSAQTLTWLWCLGNWVLSNWLYKMSHLGHAQTLKSFPNPQFKQRPVK